MLSFEPLKCLAVRGYLSLNQSHLSHQVLLCLINRARAYIAAIDEVLVQRVLSQFN